MQKIKTPLKNRLEKLFVEIDQHEVFILAGSLAFSVAVALAPFLILLLILVSILAPDVQQEIIIQSNVVLGQQASDIVATIIKHAENNTEFNGIKGIISLFIIIISASAIFSQLRYALDKIHGDQMIIKPFSILGFVKDKLFVTILLFGFVFMIISTLVANVIIDKLLYGFSGLFWQILTNLFTFALFFICFSFLFRFVPSKKVSWKRSSLSAFMASIFFILGKALISVYLGTSTLASSYGAAGSVVILLIWVYYNSLTFFVSYEFTNNVLFDE